MGRRSENKSIALRLWWILVIFPFACGVAWTSPTQWICLSIFGSGFNSLSLFLTRWVRIFKLIEPIFDPLAFRFNSPRATGSCIDSLGLKQGLARWLQIPVTLPALAPACSLGPGLEPSKRWAASPAIGWWDICSVFLYLLLARWSGEWVNSPPLHPVLHPTTHLPTHTHIISISLSLKDSLSWCSQKLLEIISLFWLCLVYIKEYWFVSHLWRSQLKKISNSNLIKLETLSVGLIIPFNMLISPVEEVQHFTVSFLQPNSYLRFFPLNTCDIRCG